MKLTRSLLTGLYGSMLLISCGGTDGERQDSGTPVTKDGSTTGQDGSTGSTDGGTTPYDAGTNPTDGGTNPGVCNPVTGSGCAGAQICVWVQNLQAAQCRDPAQTQVLHEQQCDAALQNCQAGYTCIQAPGSAGSACMKVCDANDNADCLGLAGSSQNGYSCALPLTNNGAYWGCVPTPQSCVPTNDQCPAGEYCQVTDAAGNTGCIPEGTATVGTSCQQAACMKGGMCLNFGNPGDPICYEPCDPNTSGSCTNPNDICGGFTINGQPAPFGVCSTAPQGCLPFQPNDCPADQNCEVIASDGSTGCVPSGTAAAGQSCGSSTGGCQKGSICLNIGQPGDPKCYTPCDTQANPTTCTGGACQGLQTGSGPLPFGVCN